MGAPPITMRSPIAAPETGAGWMLDALSVLVNRYRITDCIVTYCNQAWADHYGVTSSAAIGRRLHEFLSPDEIVGLDAQLQVIGPDNPVVVDSTERLDSRSTQRWLQWVDHYVVTDDGPEVMSVGYDVTDRHDARAALTRSEERFRSLADASCDIVWRLRWPGPRFDYLSPSLRSVLGYEANDMAHDFDQFLAIAEPETRDAVMRLVDGDELDDRLDVRLRHADGHLVTIESSLTRTGDTIQGVGRDVSEIRRLQASLAAAASTDSLTGLANRRAFDSALSHELEISAAAETDLALVYLDLDRLKEINDHCGHHAGDLVLCETARRLSDAVDDTDFVARLGGDEFAIIHRVRADSVSRLVDRVEVRFESPIIVDASLSLTCTASVGVAHTADHGWLPNKLVAAADRSMYEMKRRRDSSDAGAP